MAQSVELASDVVQFAPRTSSSTNVTALVQPATCSALAVSICPMELTSAAAVESSAAAASKSDVMSRTVELLAERSVFSHRVCSPRRRRLRDEHVEKSPVPDCNAAARDAMADGFVERSLVSFCNVLSISRPVDLRAHAACASSSSSSVSPSSAVQLGCTVSSEDAVSSASRRARRRRLRASDSVVALLIAETEFAIESPSPVASFWANSESIAS